MNESTEETEKKKLTNNDNDDSSPPPPPTKKATTKGPINTVVRVGVGVVVQDPYNPTKVFCGIRKGSHGSGTLSLPGGHLELYERWEDCAIREVHEEMNIKLDPQSIRLCYVSNDPMPEESKHYVTIFMMGKQQRQQVDSDVSYPKPVNMEPDKCEGWDSYTIQELKAMMTDSDSSKLFGPLKRLLEANPSSLHDFLED